MHEKTHSAYIRNNLFIIVLAYVFVLLHNNDVFLTNAIMKYVIIELMWRVT